MGHPARPRALNESGFTLVETVVSAAVTALVVLGLADVITGGMKAQAGAQLYTQFNALTSTTRMILDNGDACNQLFQGMQFKLAQIGSPSFRKGVSQLSFSAGNPLIPNLQAKIGLLTITTMDLRNIQQLGTGTNYLAEFHLEATPPPGSRPSLLVSDSPVRLSTSVSGGVATVGGCSTAGSAMNAKKVAMPGPNLRGNWMIVCNGVCGAPGTLELAFGNGVAMPPATGVGVAIPLPTPPAEGWSYANMSAAGGMASLCNDSDGNSSSPLFDPCGSLYKADHALGRAFTGVAQVPPGPGGIYTAYSVAHGDNQGDYPGAATVFFNAFAWTTVP